MWPVGMEIEINRNLFPLAKYNYPWLKNLPTSWPGLVNFFEEYTPTLGCRTIVSNPPEMRSFKCNVDGASKGNPGPSSGPFCTRNREGNLIYAEDTRLFDGTNLVAEVVALRLGLEFCVQHNLLPVILEIDSLSLKNILDGIWEIPWVIVMEIEGINMLMKDKEVIVEHILREGNQLTNFFTNNIFCFAGTQKLAYSNFQDIPSEARGTINTEKEKLPSLMIRRYQNGDFANQDDTQRR